MINFKKTNLIAASAILFVAVGSNANANISLEAAYNCGLEFERCTNTCPTKHCDGNDWKVCENQYMVCLQNADVENSKK